VPPPREDDDDDDDDDDEVEEAEEEEIVSGIVIDVVEFRRKRLLKLNRLLSPPTVIFTDLIWPLPCPPPPVLTPLAP
jgi:hypothetical protein